MLDTKSDVCIYFIRYMNIITSKLQGYTSSLISSDTLLLQILNTQETYDLYVYLDYLIHKNKSFLLVYGVNKYKHVKTKEKSDISINTIKRKSCLKIHILISLYPTENSNKL